MLVPKSTLWQITNFPLENFWFFPPLKSYTGCETDTLWYKIFSFCHINLTVFIFVTSYYASCGGLEGSVFSPSEFRSFPLNSVDFRKANPPNLDLICTSINALENMINEDSENKVKYTFHNARSIGDVGLLWIIRVRVMLLVQCSNLVIYFA